MFRKRSKSDIQTEYTASIRFLDDAESIQLTFKKDTLGQWLMDRVCEKLNLIEKDYFGLRYVDQDSQRHWLDPLKTVYKQLKGLNKMVLCFRVKFYPEDPMKLHEEITRYYLFLQLRRDLHHGRLLCPQDESIQLAAYITQSEVGDYDPEDHKAGYVAEFKMLPKQTPKHEEKIMEAHKALIGQVPSDCEALFLKKAASMDTYGVDPHQVKDQKGDQLYLGVTHLGIMTFRGNRRSQLFKWEQIRRIAYEGKMFITHHTSSEAEMSSNSKKKHQAVGFKCATAPGAKYLWRCAVEQQLFFTLSTSSTVPKIRSGGTLFSRGSKFRFSGRCQNEAYIASEDIKRSEPPFARTSSLPNFGKRSPTKENNTVRDSMTSDSFNEDRRKFNVYLASGKNKEEAAVDVPHIMVNDAFQDGPQISAPLAQAEIEECEIIVEKIEQVAVSNVSAAPPRSHVSAAPPRSPQTPKPQTPKLNGKVVKDTSTGILETSIDSPSYEPNQTFDDSDDEDKSASSPDLDDQIRKLEEEMTQSSMQNDLNLPSPTPEASKQEVKKKSSGGGCVKTLLLSVVLMLLLSVFLFFIVFFSPIEHELVSNLRQHLHFLEPVRDYVDGFIKK